MPCAGLTCYFSLGQVLWVPLLSSGHRPGIYTGIARRAALEGSALLLLLLSRLLPRRGLAPQAAATRPARDPQSEPFAEPCAVLSRDEAQRWAAGRSVKARCQSERVSSQTGGSGQQRAGKVRQGAREDRGSANGQLLMGWSVSTLRPPGLDLDLDTRVRTQV